MTSADQSQQYYDESTAQLSALVRQLGFAAIAIVWLFSGKNATGTAFRVSRGLTWVAIFTVCALALDFFQYVYKSIAWGIINRRRETEGLKVRGSGGPFPDAINWPTLVLFWTKVACTVVAYVLLGIALVSNLNP